MLLEWFLGMTLLTVLGASLSVFIDEIIDQIFDRM